MDIYRTHTHLVIVSPPHRIEIPLKMLEEDYVAQAERLLRELDEQLVLEDTGLTPDNWTRIKWLRRARDKALQETDYTQLLDAPISKLDRERYRVIRQTLRDLPATASLDNIMSQADADNLVKAILMEVQNG